MYGILSFGCNENGYKVTVHVSTVDECTVSNVVRVVQMYGKVRTVQIVIAKHLFGSNLVPLVQRLCKLYNW